MAVGLTITMAIIGITAKQARENTAMSEKLASNDFQQQLSRVFADGSVCTGLLTDPTAFPGGATFDSTHAVAQDPAKPTINLPQTKIPVSTDASAPDLVVQGGKISPLSTTVIVGPAPSFQITNLVGSVNAGVGTFTGVFQVNYDETKLVRSMKPAMLQVMLKTTASGTTQTVTKCVLATQDSCWTQGGSGLYEKDTCGNVGIGTTTPEAPLEVNPGNVFLTRTVIDQFGSYIIHRKARGTASVQNGDEIGYMRFDGYDGANYQPAANVGVIVDGVPGSNDMPGALVFKTTPDGTNALIEWMRINNAGNVGIGTTTPGQKLEVNGNVKAAAFLYSSDRRLKENIEPLDGYEKTLRLQGVSFNWKSNGQPEIGFIAQDVEKVVPELVVTDRNGMKSVKYGNMTALLVEAVKTQARAIAELNSKIDRLSQELACQKGTAECAPLSK